MTLTELYTSRIAELNSRTDNVKNTLSTEQVNKADQQEQYQYWVDRVSRLDTDIAKAEASLLATVTVAEIEAIAIELRRMRINRRASDVKMNHYRQQLDSSEIAIDNLVASLNELQQELVDTTEGLESATELEATHQAWFDNLGVEPLLSVPAKADTLLSTVVDAALTKLKNQTSDDFIVLVTNRVDQYWERLDDLESRSDSLTEDSDPSWVDQSGYDADIEIHSRKFDTAIATLSEFVANGEIINQGAEAKANKILNSDLLNSAQKAHFDSLIGVTDFNADVLAPESELRIAEHELIIRQRELETARTVARSAAPDISDADLDLITEVKEILDGADGKDSPADMRATYDAALVAIGSATFDEVILKESAVAAAETALQLATQDFIENNPDDDPAVAPELDAARQAVVDANTELTTAQTAMRASPWYKLEELEVAIPDTAWLDILHLLSAQKQLLRLKDTNLGALETDVTTANTEFADKINTDLTADDGFLVLHELISRYQETNTNIRARGSDAAFGIARGLV